MNIFKIELYKKYQRIKSGTIETDGTLKDLFTIISDDDVDMILIFKKENKDFQIIIQQTNLIENN
jgi:hypothetical protein